MGKRKPDVYKRFLRDILQEKLAKMVAAVLKSLTVAWKFSLEEVGAAKSELLLSATDTKRNLVLEA